MPCSTIASLCVLASGQEGQDRERADLRFCNLDKKGLAIEGYDPVAYFPEGGSSPKKGKREISYGYRGVTYRFANADNRERFKRTPARYEAAYGGWCAYAMADGKQVEVDPESYLIQDGRLMLFYKSFFNDTKKKWSKKPEKLQARGGRALGQAHGCTAPASSSTTSMTEPWPWRASTRSATSATGRGAGTRARRARHQGIVYRFASEENEKAFRADPSRYLPAYGG